MRRVLTLVAAGAALVPWACAAENPTKAPLDSAFELRVGAAARVEGSDVEVVFEGVPKDSRCPPGVQCITAGDATVVLRVTGGGKDATTYELHTPRGPSEVEHGPFEVSLVRLGFPPASGQKAPADGYVVTLRVSRRD
jgi:hypothetical protein